MATISAGNINLTVSTTGDFGHHVATLDTARSHVTEWRKPTTAYLFPNDDDRFVNATVTGTTQIAQSVDLAQYGWHENQYINQSNYIDSIEDYVAPANRFNQPVDLTATDIGYRFDFADYIDADSNASIEIRYDAYNTSNSNITIANVTVEPATTETIAIERSLPSVGDLVETYIDGVVGIQVSNVSARLNCEGRSYLNTTSVIKTDYTTEIESKPGTNETRMIFGNIAYDLSSFGNPRVRSISNQFAVQDRKSLTEGTGRRYDIAGTGTPELNHPGFSFRSGNVALYEESEGTTTSGRSITYVGSAPSSFSSGSDDSDGGYTGLLDIPVVDTFVTADVTDSIEPTDLSNIEVYIEDLRNDLTTYTQPAVLKTRAVLIPALAGFPDDLDSAFATTQSGQMLRIGTADLSTAFTTTADDITIFRGILQEKSANFGITVEASVFRNAASDLTTEFDIDETATVIMNVLVDDLDMAYAVDGTYTLIIGGEVDQQDVNFTTNFRGGIRQEGVSNLLGTFTAEQSPQLFRKTEKNLTANFTTAQSPQMFRQTEKDLSTQFAVTPFKPKMFLQPSQQDLEVAFADQFRGTLFSLGELDDQRRYTFPTRTRTYPVAKETRINAVKTENRTKLVTGETRIGTVNTETRILKETGYEY